jgi:hypothetical protein
MNRSILHCEAADTRAAQDKSVQLAFLQTLRQHSIPSDWLECQLLRGSTGSGRRGLHVHFVVSQGGPSLLPHVARFEGSFMRNLERLLPEPGKWVLGVAWVLNDEPQHRLGDAWAMEPAPQRDSAHAT